MADLAGAPLWAITTYYNPGRYHSRRSNFERFASALRDQQVPLVVVELTPIGHAPEMPANVAHVHLHVRSDAVLWHKERLLNIALGALPAGVQAVCWLDADVIFEQSAWATSAMHALDAHPVLQPFSAVIRLPRNAAPEDYPSSRMGLRLRRGHRSGTWTPSFAAQWQDARTRFDGTTGFAWCARREFLDRHAFYDRCIVGGADREIAMALVAPPEDFPDKERRITAPRLLHHIHTWQRAVHQDAQGRLGVLDGAIHHLWHGESEHRRYQDRHQILQSHDYDPIRDVVIDDDGCLAFTEPASGLAQDVARYLLSRREDG